MRTWAVRLVGEVPQVFEGIQALTAEAAKAIALNRLLTGLVFEAVEQPKKAGSMTRFEVLIYGTVPDSLIVEAESNDEAVNAAIQMVLERLDFNAAPAPADEASTPEAKEKQKSD